MNSSKDQQSNIDIQFVNNNDNIISIQNDGVDRVLPQMRVGECYSIIPNIMIVAFREFYTGIFVSRISDTRYKFNNLVRIRSTIVDDSVQNISGELIFDTNRYYFILERNQEFCSRSVHDAGRKRSRRKNKSSRKSKKKSKLRKKSPKKSKKKNQTSSSDCKKSSQKKYRSRPGPPYPAQNCKNKSKKGNDGNKYKSKPNKNGIYRWVKI